LRSTNQTNDPVTELPGGAETACRSVRKVIGEEEMKRRYGGRKSVAAKKKSEGIFLGDRISSIRSRKKSKHYKARQKKIKAKKGEQGSSLLQAKIAKGKSECVRT